MRSLLFLVFGATVAAGEPLAYYHDWFAGTQFAGIYVAEDKGFYRDAGLDFEPHSFVLGQNVAALVDSNPAKAAVGTLEGYILLQKRAKGADLKVFTAVLRESPAGYMTLPGRPLLSGADLAGRRVGVHKYGDPLYHLFLRRAHVPESAATMVFVDTDVDRLVRGEVDVMQGYAIQEWVQLRRKVGPQAGFLSFRQLGFDAYSQVVVTSAAQADHHRSAVEAFIRATRRGWTYAFAHPDEAVDSVLKRMGPAEDRSLHRAMLDAMAPFVAPDGSEPLGPLDLTKWANLEEACVEMGLLGKAEDPRGFVVTPAP